MNGNIDAEIASGGFENRPCPNCQAPMPTGLRFCRMCGFRLGEGVEEYTATRRFDGTTTATASSAETNNLNAQSPFGMPENWGGIAPIPVSPIPAESDSKVRKFIHTCNPMRFNWIVWVILISVVLTVAGVSLRQARRRNMPPPPPVAFVGVDGFDPADGGGAFIKGIAGVGSPIEAAGLRGGDIIISFDGKKIEDGGDMNRALRQTPIGKAVEVIFVRDGAIQTTTLTPIAERDFQGLRPLNSRPGGQGRIGVDVGDRKRVPTQNTYGVELDDVDRNGPADLAGLKEGDIVTDFAGKPVRTTGDLRYRIYEAVPGSTVKVVLVRNGERLEIDVKIGRSRDD